MTRHLLTMLAVTAIGCGKDAETSDPSLDAPDIEGASRVAISVALTSGAASGGILQAPEGSGALVTVSSASITVRDIEIDLPDGRSCEDLDPGVVVEPLRCSDDKLHLDGPYRFDLVSQTSEPPLDDVVIPEGVYKRVDLRLDPDVATDERSLTLAGDVDGAPFDLALPINEDARFENEGGLHIGGVDQILAHLDLGAVMADVPLSDCLSDLSADDDGVTYITEDGCKDVEDSLKDSLKNTFDLD